MYEKPSANFTSLSIILFHNIYLTSKRIISEIHSKVSQIAPNSMDQTVDHILTWLQSRYQNQQNQQYQQNQRLGK